MTSRLMRRLPWLILALTWLGTLAAYPSLPPIMATHFGADGRVNGTMNSLEGAFLLPLMMFVILLLFVAIPYIDPLRVNIQSFRNYYDAFVALLMFALGLIQALVIARNLGYVFDPMYVVLPVVGVLIFYTGVILPHTKRNWFIGIRTPWTISSDHVWQKTHELGGTLFKILGVIIVLGVFVPAYAIGVLFIPLVIVVLGLVLYSYVVYEQDRKA